MRKFTDIVNENKVVENNDKIVESIDTERAAQLYELASEVSTFLGEKLSAPFTNEEIEFIFGKIKADMDDFLENHLSHETPQGNDENQHIESGYGTENLSDQGITLGKILTNVEELKVHTTYCIVDLGLNEWNGGYTWLRKDGATFVFQDELSGPSTPKDIIYTDEEMSDLIENGQIAFEA